MSQPVPHEHITDIEHNITLLRHSPPARKIAFAKGVVDILISLSLFFFPSIFCDGIMTAALYDLIGVPAASWAQDPAGLASFAALVMGCGFAGVTAGISESNDAYRTVAALNGTFALTGFLICLFSPYKYGSSFLLLVSAQDILWFVALVNYGDFGCMDCLGLSSRGLYVIEERLARDVLKHREMHQENNAPHADEKTNQNYT